MVLGGGLGAVQVGRGVVLDELQRCRLLLVQIDAVDLSIGTWALAWVDVDNSISNGPFDKY